MLRFLATLLPILFVPSGCFVREFIIGGQRDYRESKDNASHYPVVVQFCPEEKFTKYNGSYCSGTLISRRHVLTAAHCVKEPMNNTYILIGNEVDECRHGNAQSDYSYKVARAIVHPRFQRGGGIVQNDIAIIELARNVSFAVNVTISSDDRRFMNTEVIVRGWGMSCLLNDRRHPHVHKLAKHLLKIRILWFSPVFCRSRYNENNLDFDEKRTFCAGSSRGGTWAGDSGGSAVACDFEDAKYRIVGVTSYGIDPPETKTHFPHENAHDQYMFPGTYMRTSYYCDFIERATEGEATCGCPTVLRSWMLVLVVVILFLMQ